MFSTVATLALLALCALLVIAFTSIIRSLANHDSSSIWTEEMEEEREAAITAHEDAIRNRRRYDYGLEDAAEAI